MKLFDKTTITMAAHKEEVESVTAKLAEDHNTATAALEKKITTLNAEKELLTAEVSDLEAAITAKDAEIVKLKKAAPAPAGDPAAGDKNPAAEGNKVTLTNQSSNIQKQLKEFGL